MYYGCGIHNIMFEWEDYHVMCDIHFGDVIVGCGLTVFALIYGLTQFKRGNQRGSQIAMRMRVLAQGGTIIAVLGGLLMSGSVERKDK